MQTKGAIGVFDSGYGGLTVLKEMVKLLPQYNFIYLGDNARSPYGTRSFETVYQYTLQCVTKLFAMGCPLVILACNTASAKALRTIQQHDLPALNNTNRVLGVIRPTAEVISSYTTTNHIGIMATVGTVVSNSYPMEIQKQNANIQVHQQGCPMLVPLIENMEYQNEAANYFVKKYVDALLAKHSSIDTVLLACTHYPILLEQIKNYLPNSITVLTQGNIVANSLANYLQRHTDLDNRLLKNSISQFYTTDAVADFESHATLFFGEAIKANHLSLV